MLFPQSLKSYESTYYTKLSILPSKLTSALPYNVHGGPYYIYLGKILTSVEETSLGNA